MAPRPPVMTATLPSSRETVSKLMKLLASNEMKGGKSSRDRRMRKLHLARFEHEVVFERGLAAVRARRKAADEPARHAEHRVAFQVLVVVGEHLGDQHLV